MIFTTHPGALAVEHGVLDPFTLVPGQVAATVRASLSRPGVTRLRTYALTLSAVALQVNMAGVVHAVDPQSAPRTMAYRVPASAAHETKWYAYMARQKSVIPNRAVKRTITDKANSTNSLARESLHSCRHRRTLRD